MDTSIIAALVGVFGAGAIGVFGFILTGLRDGIRTNGERIEDNGKRLGRLEERFGRLEERFISEFGQVKDMLARIETTQAEHGRQIEKLSGDLP
jgi:hypothetical protein